MNNPIVSLIMLYFLSMFVFGVKSWPSFLPFASIVTLDEDFEAVQLGYLDAGDVVFLCTWLNRTLIIAISR